MQRSNAALFWPILVVVTAFDAATKFWAEQVLALHRPGGLAIVGDHLRLTLVYNPGAAFGLQIGDAATSRWVFMGLTLIALGILAHLYGTTRPGDRMRTASLALVCGGAVGNLIDRVRGTDGVVDFIDIGFSAASRWPTFNVADIAVSSGAFLLAWVLWDEDRENVTAPSPVAAETSELS